MRSIWFICHCCIHIDLVADLSNYSKYRKALRLLLFQQESAASSILMMIPSLLLCDAFKHRLSTMSSSYGLHPRHAHERIKCFIFFPLFLFISNQKCSNCIELVCVLVLAKMAKYPNSQRYQSQTYTIFIHRKIRLV